MNHAAGELTAFAVVAMVAVVVVLAGLVIYRYNRRREQQRTAALRDLALPLGFHFTEKPSGLPWSTAEFLPLNRRGHSQRAKNLLVGDREGVRIALLDFQFTVGSGKHQQTYRQSLALFQIHQGSLPDFELRPEHLFDKIASAFGGQDIDFEHNPEFSRLYRLRGTDEAAIRRLFAPGLLTELERNPGLTLEAQRDTLLVCRLGKRVEPAAMRDFLLEAERLFVMIRSAA